MLWWILLPMAWTAVLLLVAGAALVWWGPRIGERFRFFTHRGWWTLVMAFAFPLLFVPSCMAVHWTTAPFRFGRFEHATAAGIGDARIRSSLPGDATSILVFRRLNGFEARYEVSDASLRAHVDRAWAEADAGNLMLERGEAAPSATRKLPGLDLYPPDRAELLMGPTRLSAAGWHVWYDPKTRTAWQAAWYW